MTKREQQARDYAAEESLGKTKIATQQLAIEIFLATCHGSTDLVRHAKVCRAAAAVLMMEET